MTNSIVSILHILAVPLAAWRLTELVAQDQITLPIRKKFPGYIWTCPRCLSVWAGLVATLILVIFPWLNWPFALSWLYFWQQDNKAYSRQLHKRSFIVVIDENKQMDITRSELSLDELNALEANFSAVKANLHAGIK